MTWGDVKLATLQKMFSADGDKIPTDGSADDYLAGMPYVANEAMNLLATTGRFIINTYVIEHTSETFVYDMKELVNDFYEIDKIVYESNNSYHDFGNFMINNGVIVLYGAPKGTYTVYYKAYPEQITNETEDTYELSLAPEVAVILPLYMASQLYKDDDNGIATSYRNEFEVAREEIKNNVVGMSSAAFFGESGWI